MTNRISLSVLLTVILAAVVVQMVSGRTKTVSKSRENASVCVECPETKGGESASVTNKSVMEDEETVSDQVDGTYRGLWMWNTESVTDIGALNDFLVFAQLKDIGGVYLYAYDLLPNNSGELRVFIAEADDIGVQVELLAGDPTWALTSNHPVALGFVQQAITFTQSITGSGQPIGIHLDVEPYLLPEWDSNRSSTITQYLDLLSDTKQELTTSSASLTLTVDIPFWYDTITATYRSAIQPLNQHVQDIADRVVIMDYRDFAQGDDGIIHHAQDEIDYAQNIAKGIVIGVETNDVAPEPEKATFFEEGETVMESELALVEEHHQTSLAFRGFAIHDYSGYLALAPIKSVYLPIVLKN